MVEEKQVVAMSNEDLVRDTKALHRLASRCRPDADPMQTRGADASESRSCKHGCTVRASCLHRVCIMFSRVCIVFASGCIVMQARCKHEKPPQGVGVMCVRVLRLFCLALHQVNNSIIKEFQGLAKGLFLGYSWVIPGLC